MEKIKNIKIIPTNATSFFKNKKLIRNFLTKWKKKGGKIEIKIKTHKNKNKNKKFKTLRLFFNLTLSLPQIDVEALGRWDSDRRGLVFAHG